MAEDQGAHKLHIDSDWKAEAQREKERLAAKEKQKPQPAASKGAAAAGGAGAAGAPGPEHGELPEASFRSLVSMLASQAIMGLGAMADRESGRIIIDLDGARFSIDLLDVLEQKTKGNLSEDEAKELRQLLAELRSRFVQISQMVAKQMAAQGAAGVSAVPPGTAEAVAGKIKPPAGQ